jgi:hypothetical protein
MIIRTAAKVAPPVPRSLTTFSFTTLDMFRLDLLGSMSGQAPLSQSDSHAAIPSFAILDGRHITL